MSVSLSEEQIKKILVDITNKWTNSVGNPFDLEGEQAKAISSALIGKCGNGSMAERKAISDILIKRKEMLPHNAMWVAAEIQEALATPTFSGEKEHEAYHRGFDDGRTVYKPTEQKEITCKHGLATCNVCKPIPAEKKECEHEWKLLWTTSGTDDPNIYKTYGCKKCGEETTKTANTTPEPKPKERIEPLKGDWVTDSQAVSKLCVKVDEIVDFINNRKE